MNVLLVTRYMLGFAVWLTMAPVFADATLTEIEFWQSVKDSGDAEMLRAYLQEFPDGNFKALANIKIEKLNGPSEVEYLWCATKSAVTKQTKESCNQLGGKSFGNKDSALNEKNRRNEGGSTTALKTTGSKARMSGVEKECFEDFHRYNGSEWRRAVQGQAADGPVDDIDLYKCKPFVSKDMKTWIGSNPDTGGSISSESVSNNNDAQNSVQSSSTASTASTASTVAISRRQWCVTSSGVSNRPYAECLKKNGIPTRGQAGAIVDRASSYFREWKKNKAFAISTDSIGDSGSWKSGGDAIKRSLLNCYIYSSVPSSCRVVNVNGQYEEHFDEQRARDSAFGANGSVDNLVGTYYFEMNYQGIDGTLRVKMSGGSISAKLETCIEGICTDWTLKPNPYTRGGRRLTGTMKRGAKGQSWSAREIFLRASFSKDTKRIIGTFGFYEFEGKKRSAN
jgi:hypothetical protein